MKFLSLRHFIAGFLLFSVGAYTAYAQAPRADFAGIVRYEFTWSGIDLGKIALLAEETDQTYGMRTLIKSRGVVSLFVKHTSDTFMSGIKNASGYIPQTYETRLQTRNKKKHIKLGYDAAGQFETELSEPEDTDRPKVPAELKKDAHDPLASVFDIRAKLHAALQNSEKTFSITLYDGRRLSRIQVDIPAVVERQVAGTKQRVIHTIMTRVPLSGYTEKELESMKGSPNALHVYFSDDAKLWPLLMEVHVFMATLKGELTKTCDTIESCF